MATWTKPDGGLFVWLAVADGVDTWDMLREAIDHQVVYIPGAAFAVNGGHRNTMRLNFSNVAPEHIAEGVRRLAAVVRMQG